MFHNAYFIKSASNYRQLPIDQISEIAFIGRSNSGKSSALNSILNNKKLAKTSNTPGRTQLINLFMANNTRFVDLPGYGFAKVPLKMKLNWQKLIGDYLTYRQNLNLIVITMDIRHPLQPNDIVMLNWLKNSDLKLIVLLTKADKLSKNKIQATKFAVEKNIKSLALNINYIVHPYSIKQKNYYTLITNEIISLLNNN